MEYTKPFLTYEEQADLLLQRGLVAHKETLIEHLRNVGYYRLSGYLHIFKRQDDTFWENTTFDRVWDLYVFDRQFKLLVLDAIERVEVYVRTQLAYELSSLTEPFGYLKKSNLPNLSDEKYEKFIYKCREAFSRSREPFALHFKKKYGDIHALPPYWILVNLMDFGMILTLYRGAPNNIRKSIASSFKVTPKVMDSWLVMLNTIRNICAHHGRLWNRTLGTKPLIPKEKNDSRWHSPYTVQPDKIFVALTILSVMLETAAPHTQWRKRLVEKLKTRSVADLRRMGFTEGWTTCPLWKNGYSAVKQLKVQTKSLRFT